MSADVDNLVATGQYKEAALLATTQGMHARAAELYERIWDFNAAAQSAEAAGDLPRALSNALEARDLDRSERLATTLIESGEAGKRDALTVFIKRRRFPKAAALAEELGELDDAIRYYQEGHLDFEAARLLVKCGRDRDAGRILERAVKNLDPSPERSRAHLLLGQIFARLLQHDESVRCLQEAEKEPSCQREARRAMVLEFAALGLRDAARDILLKLRKEDESLPADLEAYIRQARKPRKPRMRDVRIIGGRYRLEKLLGSGASGRVYRAKDEVSEKVVAIKLLSGAASQGGEPYQRFAREATMASSLRHANLVEVFDFSSDLGFLVMELMVGGSLEEKLKEGITPGQIRRMSLDILGGLELAHQRGIIHRDLKPANIFFDARGVAKIGDFGVAHLLDLGTTQTGGLIGTLAYMSPEQITGAPLSIAADLYGVGVTLFESLTGRLPFQGPDFVAQHLGEAAPAPSEVSHVDPAWDAIVLRLLEKNPGDRFDSIASLRRALQSLDLSEAPRPMLMPRGAKARRTSQAIQAVVLGEEQSTDDKTRYAFETPLGKTAHSRLSRAIDTSLNRSVIIERFHEPLDEDGERRLFALARGGGPFVQRALGYEKKDAVAIFEAPTGSPIDEVDGPLSRRLASRLLMRLARAVAPLHANDRVHGGLGGKSILLDDRGHPTILVSGLEPLPHTPTASDDVRDIVAVIARAVGHEVDEAASPAQNLTAALLTQESAKQEAERLEMSAKDGDELYALAEAIELVLLADKQRQKAEAVAAGKVSATEAIADDVEEDAAETGLTS